MDGSFVSHLRGGDEKAESITVDLLSDHIQAHEKHDRSRSLLSSALSLAYTADESSLQEIKDLRQQLERAEKSGDAEHAKRLKQKAARALNDDMDNVEWQDEISHYGGGFLKTASLFARGKTGWAGSVLTFAADQVNHRDPLATQAVDLTLGGLKGGLMKGAFTAMGAQRFKYTPIAIKGIALGSTMRLAEMGLTRQTYLDPKTGRYNLDKGLERTFQASFNRDALITDVILFAGSHAMLGKANAWTGGAIEKSPFLQTTLTGTTFGLSAGALGEIQRQHVAGEKFDAMKVIKRSALQGLVDTAAAGFGYQVTDPHFHRQVKDTLRTSRQHLIQSRDALSEKTANFFDSATTALAGGEFFNMNPGLRPAFALAGAGEVSLGSVLKPQGRQASASDNILMMSVEKPSAAPEAPAVAGERMEAPAASRKSPRPGTMEHLRETSMKKLEAENGADMQKGMRKLLAAAKGDRTIRQLVEDINSIPLEKLPEEVKFYLRNPEYIELGDVVNQFMSLEKVELPRVSAEKAEQSIAETKKQPLSIEELQDAIDTAFDYNYKKLALYEYSEADIARAKEIALEVLSKRMPHAEPVEVDAGSEQIAIMLEDGSKAGSVLKIKIADGWESYWGTRENDAPMLPLGKGGPARLTFRQGNLDWSVYRQPRLPMPDLALVEKFIMNNPDFFDSGAPLEASRQLGMWKGKVVVFDYGADGSAF